MSGAPGHPVAAPFFAPFDRGQGAASLEVAPARERPAIIRQFELTEKVSAYDPKADTSLIDAAYVLAMKAHGAQKRDNGDPYITHPVAVADILADYRLDTASIVTGLLHDVIEDTQVGFAEIDQRFGHEVAGLVDGVTKLTRLELQSDRTRQAENFRKLVLAMSRDIRVLLVKLADRLHNMRTIHFIADPDRRRRIARETMEIYAPLAERIGMDELRSELQTRAFAQIEPEAFETIQARLNFLRGQGADVIDEVGEELRRVCQDGGLPVVSVFGREKSPYSIWQKMQQRNVAFEQLSDIMAFRIVVPTKEACYAALGAVHSAYPVIAGRFKDYISTPKANGYQSVHTGVTLREPRNQKIEVQIRTQDMDEIAEAGVAAHWLYKQNDASPRDIHQFRWVQDLLEILEDSSAPDEFLENTKLELYNDQVFCFTPKGELIQLPRGATPVDFAYAVHSQVGDACVGAKVNGRLMPLRYQLQNGDQVEIMTARGGTPSVQWERFVVTGKARARIRRFIHQQQRQENIDRGKAELVKAFRQAGVDGSEKALEPAVKALKCAAVDDLYIAVGNGSIGPKDVVHAAYPELRQTPRAPRVMPSLPARPSSRGGTSWADSTMPVTGLVPGMAYSFAGCCHPVPGDDIVGIVTTGKGVTIHARGCATLDAFAATPERFIDVGWNEQGAAKGDHTARVSVIAANEPSALADVANAVAKQEGAVSNLRIVHRQQDFLEVLADVDVRDTLHLAKVIAGLRGMRSIKSVERARG